MIQEYRIRDVVPYINWLYFFHAWGFESCYAAVAQLHDCEGCRRGWIASFAQKEERNKATEAIRLFSDATKMLQNLDDKICVRTKCRLCIANSNKNDLLLDGIRLPLLRQQATSSPNDNCLCLSDFVQPLDNLIKANGVCSDVIYRHIFDNQTNLDSISLLKKEKNYKIALITIPEYPGIFHLQTIWGKFTSSDNCELPKNLIQLDYLKRKEDSVISFNLYDPHFLNFYFFVPPYIRKLFNEI